MKSNTLKNIIFGTAVILFFASFILGNAFPISTGEYEWENEFNYGLMIACWVVDFFFVVIGMCISSILKHQESTSDYEDLVLKKMDEQNKKLEEYHNLLLTAIGKPLDEEQK